MKAAVAVVGVALTVATGGAGAAVDVGLDAAVDASTDVAVDAAEDAERKPPQKTPATRPTRNPAACPGGQSFAAGTKVLLASGAAIPISQLKPGEKVLATNTKTGKTQAETVTAVIVHHDTDLYDLTVKPHRTAVIHTTTSTVLGPHQPPLGQGRAALKSGIHLRTPGGGDGDCGRRLGLRTSRSAGCGT